MPIVSRPVLKSYFEDGLEPDENKYIDLVDTLSDAESLGGIAAMNYLQRTSANRPGVYKLYRNDSDTQYNVQTYWTGAYWHIQGYNGDTYHAPAQVTHADMLDGLHAASFHREDQNLIAQNYDIRTNQGIYVGSTGINPGTGKVQATTHINATGGVRAGSQTATSNGWVRGTTLYGDYVYAAAIGGLRTRESIFVGYDAYNDADHFRIQRHAGDAHVYNQVAVAATSNIYMNWYGNGGSFNTATRIGNGRSGYGNIHADNFTNESKRSSKRNIRSYKLELPSSLDLIALIEPVKFMKASKNATRPNQDRIGMIAEDLFRVLPEVVVVDDAGEPEGIDYGQIVPLLILSIQELTSKVEELEHGRNF